MSSLRLFSLQGISRISELTKSIKKLVNLEILDLKSCHNLEEIPDEIRFLKNLTHLDISNCYLIDHMPRGLSSLKKLQVLKGFVVGDYRNQKGKFCTLDDLKEMKSLRKLSVIVSKREFPTEAELGALEALKELHILTLSWGANSAPQEKEKQDANTAKDQAKCTGIFNCAPRTPKISRSNTRKPDQEKTSGQFPQSLKKLDLQCYPHPTSPPWLSPGKLEKLEKLYIRGAQVCPCAGWASFKVILELNCAPCGQEALLPSRSGNRVCPCAGRTAFQAVSKLKYAPARAGLHSRPF